MIKRQAINLGKIGGLAVLGAALPYRRGAVDDVPGRRLLQEPVERLALFGIERAEHVILRSCERAFRLGQLLSACLREIHHVPPSILVRPPAQNQPPTLELVEQSHQVGAVDLQRRRERLLRRAPAVAQHRQRQEMTRAQAERSQSRLGPDAGETSEVIEERRRSVAGRRGDDPQMVGGKRHRRMLSLVC